ncbi:hypothetical protein FJTKL_15384 [Diaporthe vaccinii]|uniref:Uncharacterized protein n=1 Tax=Diaporthe vaccinii TaxID=105482 RepID=A0ABR4E4W1_9PEZI
MYLSAVPKRRQPHRLRTHDESLLRPAHGPRTTQTRLLFSNQGVQPYHQSDPNAALDIQKSRRIPSLVGLSSELLRKDPNGGLEISSYVWTDRQTHQARGTCQARIFQNTSHAKSRHSCPRHFPNGQLRATPSHHQDKTL